MGAYLSKPKTEKISDGSTDGKLSYGVSCMQGWRVSMEDAHTCMLDFDNSSTLFAVYDGHGGSEVAQYVAKTLPDVLKSTESYQKGEIKQSMVDCFLEVDQLIISDQGLTDLKELAGVDKDLDEEEDLEMLEQEAMMPLHELLAKMKEMKKARGDDNGDEEFNKVWAPNDQNEADGGDKNGDEKQSNHTDENDYKNGKEKIKENCSMSKAGRSSSGKNTANGSLKEGKERDSEEKNEVEDGKPQDREEATTEARQVKVGKDANDEKGREDEANDNEDDEEREEEEDDGDDDDDDEDGDNDDDEDDDDNEMPIQTSDEVGYDSGTTAIVALLRENHLTVANVGDSRCVLCRNGIALEMSVDHKPDDELELNRIHKAGGKVTCEGRVNGGLNLSRALGDHSYKLQSELSAHEQQITAVPDVKQTQLTEADEFMVIACDGIWNVKGSQEVVDFVADRLREQRKNEDLNLAGICEELLDACLAPDTSGDGSGCDNMTTIVVVFNSASNAAENNNKKRKVQEDEKPADKRTKADDS